MPEDLHIVSTKTNVEVCETLHNFDYFNFTAYLFQMLIMRLVSEVLEIPVDRLLTDMRKNEYTLEIERDWNHKILKQMILMLTMSPVSQYFFATIKYRDQLSVNEEKRYLQVWIRVAKYLIVIVRSL